MKKRTTKLYLRPVDTGLLHPWALGHAVLCVWKPERRSFTHSKSHARLPSVSPSVTFFPEPFGDLKTIHVYNVGGRTDTANRLSENHL